MFRRVALALCCVAFVAALGPAGSARAMPTEPIFGQIIDMVNHTSSEIGPLTLLPAVQDSEIIIVAIPQEPCVPVEPCRTGLLNALDRNALSLTAMRGALGNLMVLSSDPTVCDSDFGCPMGGYLATQGVSLDQVIGAIPVDPIAPVGTGNPLVIYFIPQEPT